MQLTRALSLLLPLVATVSASCIHGTTFHRRSSNVPVADYSFTGPTGPLKWATLKPEYALCATGKRQSPINIDSTISVAQRTVVASFPNVADAEFANLGNTLEVVVDGTTTFGQKAYTLKQYHFHTPSEHRIAEEYYPLELHMVHQAADESLLVIALMFELTEDNSSFDLLTATVEDIETIAVPGTTTETGSLDFDELESIINTASFRTYVGSLTTPPCKQGVRFLIKDGTLPINVATYKRIKSIIKFNARYTQNALGQNNLLA
ncbi:alpha carbonic anhydrase [Pterulicium gracile]|uniref:Carbonic anhydrase n=1 Tax=Pterulicium gracile TaxID=1884261 RepID=A0A5C3QP63_9AGAR|nr:alpha carbonic anhydrase [Pterula gracilis]